MLTQLAAFYRRYGHQLPLAFKAIVQMRCRVALYRGKLRGRDDTVTVLYAGRQRSLAWLLRSTFDEWQELHSTACTVFTSAAPRRRLGTQADVEILDFGWPYDVAARRSGRYLEAPAWLAMQLALPRTLDALPQLLSARLRRTDLRLIEREGYRCEITRDPAQVESFHQHMYLPSMRQRHGSDAVIVPLRLMQKRARSGWLLRIIKGDEAVAAGINHAEGDTLYFLWMGMPGDRPMAAGASSALYWFGLRQAIELGCRHIDFGGSRPGLDDGPLRFKRKWGARIEDTFDPGAILIAPRPGSVAAIGFCAGLPLVIRGRHGLEALFVTDEGPVDGVRLRALVRDRGCDGMGIERATLIGLATQDCTEELPPELSGCRYRVLQSRPESFAETYVQQGKSVSASVLPVVAGVSASQGLIDWPAGQQLPGIVGCRHHLLDTALFSDEALLEVFDRHNPDELLVYRMGEDHHQLGDFQYGSRGKLTAQQLLEAVKAGRLWLNIIHITQMPAYRDLVDRIYDELEQKVAGFRAIVRSANLLVSSPGAKVYYHADAPLNMLWHLRGEKRIWIYPDGEKYAPREWVEMLFTRESDDDLPYRPEFDADATAHELRPGEMLTWPQNRPHRVENVQGLCVSLTTEHYTPEAMKKRLTYLSNRYLREWFRLPATGTALHGPTAVAKRALFRVARHMPWFREASADDDTAKFSLDR